MGAPLPLTLYSIPYSPWSERARWALLHHRLPFNERSHTPLLGELSLRLAARKLGGGVSVPLLLTPDGPVGDSMDIVAWADAHGSGSPLLFDAAREVVASLRDTVEDGLSAARARGLAQLAHDPQARRDALPPWMRKLPAAGASARVGGWFVARKYGSSFQDLETRQRASLSALRTRLEGRKYLAGSFSAANLLGASLLQAISPPDDAFLPIEPGTRRQWTEPALAADFANLLSWRNALYTRHRPKAGALA